MAAITAAPTRLEAPLILKSHTSHPALDAIKLNSPSRSPQISEESSSHFLVTSPYTAPEHLLDLSSISSPNRLLALSLTELQPVREDYATAPYKDAFNWSSVITKLRSLVSSEGYDWQERTFYVVVFRSRVAEGTDRKDLGSLDEASHQEAVKGGGLLKYWFGVPDRERRNVATCKCAETFASILREEWLRRLGVWRNKEDARLGSGGEGHRRAAMATRGLYAEWKIERLALVIGDGAEHWRIESWRD